MQPPLAGAIRSANAASRCSTLTCASPNDRTPGVSITQPPPGKTRLIGADASHAWVAVFCPEASADGWIAFDPTNNLIPDTEHITLAWGRDFGDVSPMRGVILGGGKHDPVVEVTVMPEAEWQARTVTS